ncbi:MAG: PKD domain-containing protein, partial [Oceanipulchritudo sp.]
ADTILASALAGSYVHRADMAEDGHMVALVPSNPGDPDQKAGNGAVYVFDAAMTQLNSFSGGYAQTLDVAIDSATETVFTIGFTNKFTWGGVAYGPSTPVDVPGLRGVPYDYNPGGGIDARWAGYNWEANVWLDEDKTIPNPRYINYPFSTDPEDLTEDRYPLVESSNMADSRGYRVEMGPDGNLYAAFEFDGGNTPFRWSPFDLEVAKSPVGGDIFHQTFNTSTVPKVFFGRYLPATGELMLSQWYTNRLYNSVGPPNDNTVRMKGGVIWADAIGRVYIGGTSAYGLPIPGTVVYSPNPAETTFNPFDPSAYTGGAYFMVYSADFATRLFTTRLTTSGYTKAIAARFIGAETYPRIAWAGDTNLTAPLFTLNAVQPQPGYGPNDATFAVLGGDLFDGSDGYTFELDFSTPYVSTTQNLRNQNESTTVLDIDGDSLADDSRSGYALILPTGDTSPETPLSPQSGYTGPAFWGGVYADRLDTTSNSLADNKVTTTEMTIRSQPPDTVLTKVHGVFFIPKSEFTGLASGDILDFSAGDSLDMTAPGWGGGGQMRLLVRDGTDYFVSEEVFTEGGGLSFIQDVEDGRWAQWTIPAHMDFDPLSATFADQNFTDITGLGYIIDTPNYNDGRFYLRWRTLTARMRLNGFDNQPPVPLFTATPESGQIPLSVTFDSSPSHDVDGSVDFVSWIFGDGEKLGGPLVNHTYLAAGVYYPTISIFDDQLSRQEASQPVDAFLGLLSPSDSIFASFGGDSVGASRNFTRRFTTPLDLDGDTLADDYLLGNSFSDTDPLTDSGVDGTPLYGAIAVQSIDGEAGLAESRIKEASAADIISLRVQAENAPGGALVRGLFYLDKADFLGDARTEAVSFGDGSTVLIRTTENHWDSLGTTRWLIRDAATFYVSEDPAPFSPNQTVTLVFNSATDHGRWAEYDPSANPDLDFDETAAVFTTRQFTDVTAVGIFFERDTYSGSRSWGIIDAIEATGLIGAPPNATYEDWLGLHFTPGELADSGLEATLWGGDADPEGDGANKLEILLMGDPRVFDLPGLVGVSRDSGDIVLSFSLRTAVESVPWPAVFEIQSSTTLEAGSWSTLFDSSLCDLSASCSQGDVDYLVLESFSDYRSVEIRIPEGQPRLFLRILVP